MRLIDADKLQKHFEKVKAESTTLVNIAHIIGFQSVIDAQPTAYDIDEVVDELKKASCMARPVGWSNSKKIVETNTAIEIIKSGGLVSDHDNFDLRR